MLSSIPLCIPITHLYLLDCCVNPLCWPNCRGIHVLLVWKAGFALKGISTSSVSPLCLTVYSRRQLIKADQRFIEEYATNHVPLPTHPLPITPSRAAYILDQLVSCVRDTLHEKGRVCHRDLKGDNILVDADSGDIIILGKGICTRPPLPLLC